MTDHQAKLRTFELFKEWQKKHPEKFAKFIFPIIRHLAETDLIEQLVSVQPMRLPAGQILYLDFVYDTWYRRLWRWFRRVILRRKVRVRF